MYTSELTKTVSQFSWLFELTITQKGTMLNMCLNLIGYLMSMPQSVMDCIVEFTFVII